MKRLMIVTGMFMGVALCLSQVASADTPPPYPEVIPKRIKAPRAGTRERIRIQIGGPVALPKASAPSKRSGSSKAHYEWYWSKVSPAIADSVPGRLPKAVAALTGGPAGASVKTPRLQAMQAIAERHGVELLKATIGTRVSPAFALAVIGVESAGRSDAVSHKGATGLMQLMPATAARFGVTDSRQPAQNIRGGVAYLNWLMGEFDGDPILVLAAYNAGENAVRKHKGVPPFAETRDYVPKVLAAWTVARNLCATPPQLVSDGCVFDIGARADTAKVKLAP